MAKADAWGLPAGGLWRRWRLSRRTKVAGNARLLAAPAYERLLAIEPYLRKAIPILIVLFLLVMAAVRALSLMAWRDDIERDTRSMLSLMATTLSQSIQLASNETAPDPEMARNLLTETAAQAGIPRNWVVALTDEHFVAIAAIGDGSDFMLNRPLENLIAGAQPLLMFGSRETGIAPEFAAVLRNRVLFKDRRWLVLEPAAEPPANSAQQSPLVLNVTPGDPDAPNPFILLMPEPASGEQPTP